MGLSVFAAVAILALSLFGQSSGVLRRAGINSRRIERRSRGLTGYAFALLLLAAGFFVAGVPLGGETGAPPEATPGDGGATPAAAGTVEGQGIAELGTAAAEETRTPPPTPQTGAFDRPPATAGTPAAPPLLSTGTITAALSATPPPIETAGATEAAATATTAPTATPSATPTPSPTATPSPTLTPTPITGETATVTALAGGVWIKRAPNGQNLVLVNDGDTIILRPGHANYGGEMWREVSAVTGETGWLQEQYIAYDAGQP